jgi:hypothetical protein
MIFLDVLYIIVLVLTERIFLFLFVCYIFWHGKFISFDFDIGCRAKLVDYALASGKIYEGAGFKYIKESFENGTLHLIGLLSDGGVHSRLDQLQVSHIYKCIIMSCSSLSSCETWMPSNIFNSFF